MTNLIYILRFSIFIFLFLTIKLSGYCQFEFNFPPTINPIPDYGPIAENSGLHQITLTGISPGSEAETYDQIVIISASSDNSDLIGKITVQYDQGAVAFLRFFVKSDVNGEATITVTLNDGQISNNITRTYFDVNVYPVNGQPFFELSTGSIIKEENAGKVEINNFVSSFDDGDPELDQELIFNTSVKSATQFLKFKSAPEIDENNGKLIFEVDKNSYGQALISVLLIDDGGTQNGGVNTSDETIFTIQINNVNNPPTINNIPSPVTLFEDDEEQVIELKGISSGVNENQQLSLSVQTDNSTLFANLSIDYQDGDNKALLKFTPGLNLFGEGSIFITVDDGDSENNLTTVNFLAKVSPIADTPSVTNATTDIGIQTTSGLVISRNKVDGEEVSHYKISNIKNGVVFKNNGTTKINNNQFITHQQGNAGLKFTPSEGATGNGSFDIQAATGASNSNLGGAKIKAQIVIDNDPPSIISVPDSISVIAQAYQYEIIATDPNENNVLKYSCVMPQSVNSWLTFKDNNDGTAMLMGTAPAGAEGIYPMIIIVKDQFGASDKQTFNLSVNKLNGKPVLLPLVKYIDEDDTVYLNKGDFDRRFIDADGDTLHSIMVVSAPLYGRLLLNGVELSVDDVFEIQIGNEFTYVPNKDYSGVDIIDWNSSDGKDFAEIPQRLNIFISAVNDPPEILNFEDYTYIYEYGQEQLILTDKGEVLDVDGDNIEKATVHISKNYIDAEDSLYYDEIEGLIFTWNESGILDISGSANPFIYEQAIRSIAYVNKNRLSPSGSSREIDILLYDSDTVSITYTRQIEFEDNFVELKIPTGFTPNDDGVNDTWDIENLTAYQDVLVEVYSRSGHKVFESESYYREWDGIYNGRIVPGGTYYYIININKLDKVFKGTISVLR